MARRGGGAGSSGTLRSPREGPLPPNWVHLLRYQVLRREAEAAIRGAAAPEDKVAP